jgi:hypothetical protein
VNRRSWWAIALMAGAALAAPAGAQQPAATPSAIPALDSSTATRIAAVLADARSQGLPTDPIVAKVRLGALRRAPDSLIVAAAQAVAQRLALARDALAPRPAPGDVAAGADALSAGVTPEALRTIRAAAGTHPVAVPLGVVAELTATGVPPARAATIITALMKRGAPAHELVALGNDVNADVRAGARADASLGVRIKRLDAILPTRPAAPSATSPNLPTTTGTGRGGGG